MIDTWQNAFGYEKINNFFSASQIKDIDDQVKKLANEQDKKNYVWKYYEKDKTTLSRIEYFVKYNDYLNNLALDDNMLRLVTEKMDDTPVLFKDKINFKYPAGAGFEPHQDITAGWGAYTNKHITVAIPLCDTNEENGCIFFGKPATSKLTADFQDLEQDIFLEPCQTKIGDIVLFDSYVPHASYKNKTSFARAMVFFTYTPFGAGDFYEAYHADKFNNVPPDIHKVKGRRYRTGNSNSKKTTY